MGSPFYLDAQHEDGRYRLALSGEFDLAAVPGFERALQTVCADGASAIVIDLSGVTFIDSAALRALLVGHELCISHGAEYWLDRDMASPVKRLLEIAGVGRVPFIGEP